MSVSADTLALLVASGINGDALVAIVRSMEADNGPSQSSGAERQRRYRDKKRGDATGDVTGDVTDVTPVPLGSDGSPKIISNPSFPPQPSVVLPDPIDAEPVKPPKAKVEVPEWVPAEPWASFVAMRRAAKAPFTVRAADLILIELTKLKDAGEPPGDVLDQSTRNGWRDVFKIKEPNNVRNMGRNDRLPTAARSQLFQGIDAALDEARRATG